MLERWNEGLPPGAHPNTTTVRAVALYAAACGDAKTASAVVRGALDWRTADRALTTEDPSWPAACPGNAGLPATPSRAEVWAACGPSAHVSAAEWTAAQERCSCPSSPNLTRLASCPAWPEDRATGYPVLAIAIYHDLSQRPEVPTAMARATARAVANLPPAP